MNNTLELTAVEKRCREYLSRRHIHPRFALLHGMLAVVLFIVGCKLLLSLPVLSSNALIAAISFGVIAVACGLPYWIHTWIIVRKANGEFVTECPSCANAIAGHELPGLGFSGRCSQCGESVVNESREGTISWGKYYATLLREGNRGACVVDRQFWGRWAIAIVLFAAMIAVVMILQYLYGQ